MRQRGRIGRNFEPYRMRCFSGRGGGQVDDRLGWVATRGRVGWRSVGRKLSRFEALDEKQSWCWDLFGDRKRGERLEDL